MNPIRKRPKQVLKSNVRYLPAQILAFQKQGRTADAERSARILEESTAELQRRGELADRGAAQLSYSPEAYADAFAKWTSDIPAGLSS